MPTVNVVLHDPVWRRSWRALLMLLLGAVAWLAFMPHPPANPLPQGDKIGHLVAFAALAAVATLAAAPSWRRTALCAGGLLLYGAAIEIVQTQLPARSGEWLDLLADTVGIALGLALAHLMRRLHPAGS